MIDKVVWCMPSLIAVLVGVVEVRRHINWKPRLLSGPVMMALFLVHLAVVMNGAVHPFVFPDPFFRYGIGIEFIKVGLSAGIPTVCYELLALTSISDGEWGWEDLRKQILTFRLA